jgi:hypothetical protein
MINATAILLSKSRFDIIEEYRTRYGRALVVNEDDEGFELYCKFSDAQLLILGFVRTSLLEITYDLNETHLIHLPIEKDGKTFTDVDTYINYIRDSYYDKLVINAY